MIMYTWHSNNFFTWKLFNSWNHRDLLSDKTSDENNQQLELRVMTLRLQYVNLVDFSSFGSEDNSICSDGEFMIESQVMKITSSSMLIVPKWEQPPKSGNDYLFIMSRKTQLPLLYIYFSVIIYIVVKKVQQVNFEVYGCIITDIYMIDLYQWYVFKCFSFAPD